MMHSRAFARCGLWRLLPSKSTRPIEPLVTTPAETIGLYHFWRKAKVFAVTDQRILTKKGIINKNERNLPLIYVQDASVTRSLGVGNVSVSTAGGGEGLSKIGPLKSAEARRFTDAILAHARKEMPGQGLRHGETSGSATPSGGTPGEDAYTQLRKLGELRDAGVLSDEDFEAKKTELLGRM